MAILRRKLVRRAGLVLALLAIVVACLWLWHDRPSTFTRANFDCNREGMTIGEVEAILGPPTPLPEPLFVKSSGTWLRRHYWNTAMAIAYVDVTESETVRVKHYWRRPLAQTLRIWWSRAFGRAAPF
jgi:hypothetical protein